MVQENRVTVRMSASQAKARFDQLLSEVQERRASITITRRGVPVAQLVPVPQGTNPAAAEAGLILREFIAFRDAHPLDGITTRELVQDRRRE